MADEATSGDAVKEQQPTSEDRLHLNRSPSPSPGQKSKKAKTVPLASAPSSLTASPKTSREPSPTRSTPRLPQPTTRLSRSRKNSQDQSPQRGPNVPYNIPATPSAAAIQRALAAAGANRIPSPVNSEFAGDVLKPQRQSRPAPLFRNSRLTSPPPSSGPAILNIIKSDLEPPATPSIIVNSATPKSASSFDDIQEEDEEDMPRSARGGIKSPSLTHGTSSPLEVVQESSGPETPAIQSNKTSPLSRDPSQTRPSTIAETISDDIQPKSSKTSNESGSESAGAKSVRSNANAETPSDTKNPAIAQPTSKQTLLQSRRSYTQLNSTKNKIAGEGSVRNMTVETETVSSIPHMVIGSGGENRAAANKSDSTSTVRLKPSSETIRPKKEKKKTVRKAPSITSGTGSSRADIFEAKVRSAVDEVNSSDSEETFVYESNPPEPLTRPQNRYHSRTPSMTSVASQGEHYRNRFRPDGQNSLVGKKSMKFASTSKNMNAYGGDVEDVSSTGTPTSGRPNLGNGSQQYPRHIGRHGRTPGHLSILDDNAPFQGGSPKSPRKANGGSFSRRTSPRPYSPRTPHVRSARTIGGIPYDLEADDERTPLIYSARTPRTARRRQYSDGDNFYYEERDDSPRIGVGKCIALAFTVVLSIAMVVFGLILCSKPLQYVHLKEIANVLASDREIIFDLEVHAMNPNLIAVQITELDILVLAKSKYVGTSKYWRDHSQLSESSDVDVTRRVYQDRDASSGWSSNIEGGVDEGTDPIDEDPHTMLLGPIYRFDAPLTFDASPLRHQYSSSIGEVRLNKPGNATETGGSDRWETVIQHDFELIVRGVVKYSLPVSSRSRSAAISGRKLVHPDDPVVPEKPISRPIGNGTADNEVGISKASRVRSASPKFEPPRNLKLTFSA